MYLNRYYQMKKLTTDIGDWTREEFIHYLENTLIPDLKESGSEGHVHDYELAIRFMRNEDASGCIGDSTQAIYDFAKEGPAKQEHPFTKYDKEPD